MKSILIIEDNMEIAELERDFLEADGIASVIETDGTKGMERALADDFDLILLDIMLPGTDGFHICRRIREAKEVPILMVSAKREDMDKIRGLGLGADEYILKPFIKRMDIWWMMKREKNLNYRSPHRRLRNSSQ